MLADHGERLSVDRGVGKGQGDHSCMFQLSELPGFLVTGIGKQHGLALTLQFLHGFGIQLDHEGAHAGVKQRLVELFTHRAMAADDGVVGEPADALAQGSGINFYRLSTTPTAFHQPVTERNAKFQQGREEAHRKRTCRQECLLGVFAPKMGAAGILQQDE